MFNTQLVIAFLEISGVDREHHGTTIVMPQVARLAVTKSVAQGMAQSVAHHRSVLRPPAFITLLHGSDYSMLPI